ncbi:PrpF domain-containing protein [Paracoccus sp. DMF-8]|uniref:2-methylaconitate cis-trans isomerase PrpF family protein n=1 Tax=Paracoccus sp. DMF-8 TaxID=3019445 RepID=UPI0023E89914|nr:PrpF domain-containing protein [Paracoccus sp. DMF-8]MDF3606693.1 PrpF domain-containing protein [Paracoccus sp. DMF-8]
MKLFEIPSTFMRGGTSKALMIRAENMPLDKEEWVDILCSAMGSPDLYGRQLNGMGGGVSSLSKVCVIGRSTHRDADVDYTFVQVQVRERRLDMSGNCGNMLSAVGPFAVDEGLVRVQGDKAHVRIHNTNTGKVIHATFPLRDGKSRYDGDLEIPGVSGRGAPIRLDFINPGGATTGTFLPTGAVLDVLTLKDGRRFEASLFDAANACCILRASDFGLAGIETPTELDARPDLLALLDEIRVAASIRMGVAADEEEAKRKRHVPFVALLSSPADFESTGGDQIRSNDMDFAARVISSGQPHQALPLTATLCIAIASRFEGSIAHEVARNNAGSMVRIGMPSGILTAAAVIEGSGPDRVPVSGGFYRTARRLFRGTVFADVGE